MTDISRKPTWRSDLTAYLETAARRAFRPGQHDCALFAAGAVKAMTGTDFARGYRSTYRSLARGQAVLRSRGYADHIDMVARLLPEVPPIMAQEGDVAVVPQGEDMALGIVQGAMIYVLMPSGLGLVPLTDAARAFRV